MVIILAAQSINNKKRENAFLQTECLGVKTFSSQWTRTQQTETQNIHATYQIENRCNKDIDDVKIILLETKSNTTVFTTTHTGVIKAKSVTEETNIIFPAIIPAHTDPEFTILLRE